MLPPPRTTLSLPAIIRGITLFTAAATTLTIRPAPPHSRGLAFRRTDLPGQPTIPALIAHVASDSRHTVLRLDPTDPDSPVVHTTEHILSALSALGVTDALLDLDGPEVPIADGSSRPFIDAILAADLAPIDTAPHAREHDGFAPIVINEPFSVRENDAVIECMCTESRTGGGGANALDLEYHLDYGPNSPLPPQSASLHLSSFPSADYINSIAPARTFCLLAEAQALRESGLFLHMQPKDMLVIDDRGRPIDNAFRFENEPARHKLLDLLGDLALVGRPIRGRIIARRSGHSLNHALALALFAAGSA